MIARVDHPVRHRPIPDHLRIVVKDDVIAEKRPADIARALREAAFDPAISRVLVFCGTRRDTEEQAEAFEREAHPDDPWRGRVGHYHAGMSKEDRDEMFERFKDGRLVVLFATKAFGMGVDVPNIHYMFHFSPPSSLEDYLQEIGRAGRNPVARRQAGFSEDTPIPCVLYATPDDFKTRKDRLHKGHLSWIELPRIQGVLHRSAVRVGALPPAAMAATEATEQTLKPPLLFPLPLDLIEQADEFREVKNPESMQRMGLYWLEQLRRISLGSYLPAHLEFENKEGGTGTAFSAKVQKLCAIVGQARQEAGAGDKTLLISTADLLSGLQVSHFADLFRVIAEAHKAGLVRLLRYVRLTLTQKRTAEVEQWMEKEEGLPFHAEEEHGTLPAFLEAAYALVHRMLQAIPGDRTLELDLDWLNHEGSRLADEYFAPPEKDEQALRKAEKQRKDFLRPARARAVLRIVQEAPDVLFQRELREEGVVYLLRNDPRSSREHTSSKSEQQTYLKQHRRVAARLLRYIHREETRAEKINLMDMLLAVRVPAHDLHFLEQVLLFLRWMGYLHMSSLLPMAIEAHLRSTRPVDGTDEAREDYRIFKNYEENRRLQALRLAALQTLAGIKDQQRQNRFIIDYFQTGGADDVLELIEAALLEIDPKHPLIQELRQATLLELEEKLSEEQRRVYQAPLDRSVMVVAGPGSGKTHTLLLRLARLIHEVNVDPASILVLAYNRAVVTEIKHRLGRLFGKLGYRSLVRSLRVFTFHGLIKYCLQDAVADLDLEGGRSGDPWVERFLEIAEQEPGRITRRLNPGTIRYVFIDEFQDITRLRYEMLRWLARPHCAVTVIGDPNQSIYGYERATGAGATRASEPYFELFQQDYKADEYRLLGNFRSLEKIIRTAEGLIALNPTRLLTEPLMPLRTISEGWRKGESYVERYQGTGVKWFEVLQSVLEERNEHGRPYREVALLFRSNPEVYLAYQRIQDQLRGWLRQHDASVTVQGDGVSLTRVREIAYYLDLIRKDRKRSYQDYGHDRLPEDYLDRFSQRLSDEDVPGTWNRRLRSLLQAVLREYDNEAEGEPTFTGLLGYVEELLKKDQGQLYKLLQLDDAGRGLWRPVPDIVLSNIHRVKGLEFDAVLIPPSFAPLPFGQERNARPPSKVELQDMFEEERRVYYVGITRARDRLIAFDWRREEALRAGKPFRPGKALSRRLGIAFDGDPYDGRIFLSKCANAGFLKGAGGFKNEAQYFDYLHSQVAVGDPLQLVRRGRRWYVQHGAHRVAVLSKEGNRYVDARLSGSEPKPEVLQGLVVTEVVRHTHDEALRSDEERGTTFARYWSRYFIRRGFTYITNFAGYATPPTE